jgi:carboxyl-terminal processing protease
MRRRRWGAVLGCVAMLSGCGGGGGSGADQSTPVAAGPAPTPVSAPASAPTAAAGCTLRERQDWAAAQLREWYLFPETLPANANPAEHASVDDYVNALTATARAQRRDRYFTYLTSIRAEDAYYNSGSSAGFGFRLAYDVAQRRVAVIEAFEGTPALAAGIDRGAEIEAIGTDPANLRSVDAIIAAEGQNGVTNALGDANAGTSRVLRIRDAGGTRTVSLTKAEFELTPVSSRYGTRIIDDGGRRVGYVNLRTFISTADPALRTAFARFRSEGVTDIVVDLRYNGGGLVRIAELMSDLLGRDRAGSDVVSYTVFRPEKAANNETRNFQVQPQSIAPTRVAFIGTGGTASASELVINAALPYLRDRAALIGSNTYGKPVGQIALDRPACDDRLRVIAFATQNAMRRGDYYDGLAGTVEASCAAPDDITHPLGDPQEGSTRQALDFLAGKPCSRIATGATSQSLRSGDTRRDLLMPDRATTAQRETPGLF